MITKAVAILLPLALAVSASAGAPPPASPHPSASVLSFLKQRGLKVDSRFTAPGGLSGYVGTIPNGKHVIFYVPRSGSVALFGNLIDAQGHNLTQRYYQHFIRGPVNKQLFKTLAKRRWIAAGDPHPRRIVYAFVDPNCPYCHQFWQLAQRAYAHGVQVRYVVVPILGGSSVGKAAAILAAKHQRAALDRNERGFRHHSGAIAPLRKIPDRVRHQIARNSSLMAQFGFDGTPGLVWKDAAGHIQTRDGLPQHNVLAQVFGIGTNK